MFGRHSGLLAIAVYAIILLAIGVTSRLAFNFYHQDAPDSRAVVSVPGDTQLAVVRNPDRAAIHYDYAAVAAANDRLAVLQANLERTTAQLQERSKQLSERNAECRALEERLDESVAFAMELLIREPTADRNEQTRDVKAKLTEDLAALKDQLQESRILSKEYTDRLDLLRMELMQADLEIAGLQDRAAREIETLIGERLAIEAAADEVLTQIGEEAVVPLISMLRHEDPEARLWAVLALGKLRLVAAPAIEPLNALTNDRDTRIAAAARRSLMLIEP